MKNLKEIATVSMGYSFRSRSEQLEKGDISIINMRNISNNKIDYDGLTKVKMPELRVNQLVKKGDIIFRSRGQRFTSVVITTEVDNTILAGPLLRIRPDLNLINSGFLSWYINHPDTQKQLERFARGSSLIMISKKYIEGLKIPIPTMQRQEKIAKLAALADKAQQITEELGTLRKTYLDASLMMKAFGGQTMLPLSATNKTL